jgi:hypothetical protein
LPKHALVGDLIYIPPETRCSAHAAARYRERSRALLNQARWLYVVRRDAGITPR